MCTTSMVGDHYNDLLPGRFPKTFPNWPHTPPASEVSREEFEALKRTVEDMRDLLIRAKEYDRRNNEPECEIEEKMEKLRKVAEIVGISLDDVIGKGASDAAEA